MMGNSFPPTRVEQVGLLELVLGSQPSGTLSVFIRTMGVQQQRSGSWRRDRRDGRLGWHLGGWRTGVTEVPGALLRTVYGDQRPRL